MEKTKTVDFPVLNYKIMLVLTDDISRSRKDKSDLVGALCEELSPYVDGLHSYNDVESNAIVFFRPDTSLGTVAHECYHAVDRMFRWIDAKHENELTAYHLGYLVDQAVELKEDK